MGDFSQKSTEVSLCPDVDKGSFPCSGRHPQGGPSVLYLMVFTALFNLLT